MSGGSARMHGHLLPSAAPPLNRAASERLGSPRGGRAHAAAGGESSGGRADASQPLARARSERLSPRKSPHGGGESSGGEGGDQLGDLDTPRLAMSHSRSSRRGRRDASDGHSASAPDVRKAHAASPLTLHGRAKSRPTSLNNSTTSLVSLGEDAVTQFKTKTLHSNIKCIAYTLGGGSLATGCADGTLHMWSSNDFTSPVHTFVGHTDACVAAAFTSGGSKLASGSWDHTVRIWETTSGKLHRALVGHQGKVTSVVFADSGEWLASGAMDETVRLWATSTGDIIDVLRHGLVHPITAVALSKGDALLAEASNDFTVRVWDTALEGSRTQQVLARIRDDAKRHEAEQYEKRASQQERQVSRSLRTSLRREFFKGRDSGASDAPLPVPERKSPDAKIGQMEPRLVLSGHTATVSDLAFHPLLHVLLSASHDATVMVHDTDTGALLTSLAVDSGEAVWACRFSADGSILALGTGSGLVELRYSKNPLEMRKLMSFHAHPTFVDSLAFSGDGLRLAAGSGHQIVLWKLKPADWYLSRGQQLPSWSTPSTPTAVAPPTTLKPKSRAPAGPHDPSSSSSAAGPAPSQQMAVPAFPSLPPSAGSEAMQRLLEQRKAALLEEENVVRALHIAVMQRQNEVDAVNDDLAHIGDRASRRADLELPPWGLVTDDASYLERLRARKRVLYNRVGRAEPKGDTATRMEVHALHPNDLERIARFEALLQLRAAHAADRRVF